MPLLNLESDDAEYLPVPTSKANWIAAIVCTFLTLYITQPWKGFMGGFAGFVGTMIPVALVLIIPVTASVLTVRYTRFKNVWGLVFVIGWILGFVLLLSVSAALFWGGGR